MLNELRSLARAAQSCATLRCTALAHAPQAAPHWARTPPPQERHGWKSAHTDCAKRAVRLVQVDPHERQVLKLASVPQQLHLAQTRLLHRANECGCTESAAQC
jgi:hypothetical protein